MLLRTTYLLESLYVATRLDALPLASCAEILVVHLSTPDHLALFLEQTLSRCDALRVHVCTHLPRERLVRDVPDLPRHEAAFHLRVFTPDGAEGLQGPDERVDLALLLHSERERPGEAADEKALRNLFRCAAARRRAIVHGDGSLWNGALLPRLLRRLLRPLLARLVPRRDAAERRLLEERLLPDPGYDPADPPPPPPRCAPNPTRTILTRPVRIEQSLRTATVLKPDLILAPPSADEIYHEGYHGAAFLDERLDWDALREVWQARRLANMRRVGLGEPPRAGALALDVGCGAGNFTALLTRLGWRTLGVDVSKAAIAAARASFPEAAFEIADFETAGTPGVHYDLIVLSHVLEHAPDDVGVLRGLRAKLRKDGGRLYVEVPWCDPPALARRPGWHRQKDHCREYSKLGLCETLRRAGYDVLAHADSFDAPHGEPFQFLAARLAPGPAAPRAVVE